MSEVETITTTVRITVDIPITHPEGMDYRALDLAKMAIECANFCQVASGAVIIGPPRVRGVVELEQ